MPTVLQSMPAYFSSPPEEIQCAKETKIIQKNSDTVFIACMNHLLSQ